MACGACADTITQAITALDPQATVTPNLTTKWVTIETQEDTTAIEATITGVGYTILEMRPA